MIYFGVFIAGYLGAALAALIIIPIANVFTEFPKFRAFFASGCINASAIGVGIGVFRLTDNELNIFVLLSAMAVFFANELWQTIAGSARYIGKFRLAGSLFAFAAMYVAFL